MSGGNDTLVFTTPTRAYSTTGKDSVTYLATAWKQAEFNIIGDGGGSKATFNTGSSITVKVAVTHGSTAAPTCASNAGTTGETNNLTLRSCSRRLGLDAVHPVRGIELSSPSTLAVIDPGPASAPPAGGEARHRQTPREAPRARPLRIDAVPHARTASPSSGDSRRVHVPRR